MTLPIGLLLAACMAVRAGRGECVRLRAILDKRLVLMAMASVSFFEVFNHTICPERVSTE